jgi:hypothetical protein
LGQVKFLGSPGKGEVAGAGFEDLELTESEVKHG